MGKSLTSLSLVKLYSGGRCTIFGAKGSWHLKISIISFTKVCI